MLYENRSDDDDRMSDDIDSVVDHYSDASISTYCPSPTGFCDSD